MFTKISKNVHAFCHLPFSRAKVSADGNLNMCCHQSENSYLGNLFEESFEELWFGNFAEDIRTATREGRLHPVCNTAECPFKYLNVPQEMHTFEANATGYPTELEFDLHGSHCNFGGTQPITEKTCIMCPRARPDFAEYLAKYPDRTDELIKAVKHLTPYLKIINVLGIAEPFWKDKIFDVLDKLDFAAHRDDIEVWTTSNGSVFYEQKQQQFADLVRRSEIHFSIDAASRETFLKIRRNDCYDAICENIKAWCTKRDQYKRDGSGRHIVLLHNNINLLNIHEVPDMVRLAKWLGVDTLSLLPTHDCGGKHLGIEEILVSDKNYQRFAEAQHEAERVAKEIGQHISISRPLALGFEPKLVQLKVF